MESLLLFDEGCINHGLQKLERICHDGASWRYY